VLFFDVFNSFFLVFLILKNENYIGFEILNYDLIYLYRNLKKIMSAKLRIFLMV